jgi:hypothetical protein
MRNARYRSNPYEAINNRFFQNRYFKFDYQILKTKSYKFLLKTI